MSEQPLHRPTPEDCKSAALRTLVDYLVIVQNNPALANALEEQCIQPVTFGDMEPHSTRVSDGFEKVWEEFGN